MGVPLLGEVAPFNFEGHELSAHLASMGNPHAVIVNADLPKERWFDCGKMLQSAPFAEVDGINVEFMTTSPTLGELDVWVYERGVGPTLACGTGACAAFAVARKLGLVGGKGNVNLPGGSLEIEKNERGSLKMGGPAREVFRGNWTA
jgi:diaminopimelate epimerase